MIFHNNQNNTCLLEENNKQAAEIEASIRGAVTLEHLFKESFGFGRVSSSGRLTRSNSSLSTNEGGRFQELYRFEPVVLGGGAYSTVREAVHRYVDNGTIYAVKTVDRTKLSEKEEKSLLNEVDILKELRFGSKIVRLVDFFTSPDKHYLVMERLQGGELFDRIVSKGHYEEDEAKETFKNILLAVDYCHRNNVIHRDLKPDNILLTSSDSHTDIKLADFGFAKKIVKPDSLLTVCGTLGYMAPEMLKRRPYGVRADMFSVGVILYILLSGEPPFYHETDTEDMHRQNVKCDFDFQKPIWATISGEAKDLISDLLTVKPWGRLRAWQALESPWIQGKKIVKKSLKEGIDAIEPCFHGSFSDWMT